MINIVKICDPFGDEDNKKFEFIYPSYQIYKFKNGEWVEETVSELCVGKILISTKNKLRITTKSENLNNIYFEKFKNVVYNLIKKN